MTDTIVAVYAALVATFVFGVVTYAIIFYVHGWIRHTKSAPRNLGDRHD